MPRTQYKNSKIKKIDKTCPVKRFSTLPNEVLHILFSYFTDVKDWRNLCLTCRRFREFVNSVCYGKMVETVVIMASTIQAYMNVEIVLVGKTIKFSTSIGPEKCERILKNLWLNTRSWNRLEIWGMEYLPHPWKLDGETQKLSERRREGLLSMVFPPKMRTPILEAHSGFSKILSMIRNLNKISPKKISDLKLLPRTPVRRGQPCHNHLMEILTKMAPHLTSIALDDEGTNGTAYSRILEKAVNLKVLSLNLGKYAFKKGKFSPEPMDLDLLNQSMKGKALTHVNLAYQTRIYDSSLLTFLEDLKPVTNFTLNISSAHMFGLVMTLMGKKPFSEDHELPEPNPDQSSFGQEIENLTFGPNLKEIVLDSDFFRSFPVLKTLSGIVLQYSTFNVIETLLLKRHPVVIKPLFEIYTRPAETDHEKMVWHDFFDLIDSYSTSNPDSDLGIDIQFDPKNRNSSNMTFQKDQRIIKIYIPRDLNRIFYAGEEDAAIGDITEL
jgi:hypothetical protein